LNAKKLSTGAIVAIGAAPIALFVAATFLSIPWLKTLPDGVVETIAIVTTVLVLGWSLFISLWTNKRQDEVLRESSKWAWMWGATSGTLFIALLLALPPFREFVNASVSSFLLEMKGHTRQAAILGFVTGFVALSVAQTVGTIVMAFVWWRNKG
jgi:hypothetical protein